MKRLIILFLLLTSCAVAAVAQTGTWSGKVEVSGASLRVVFHLDGDSPTMDSPDQGAKGIPVQVERDAAGKITVRIPSIAATYEGLWLGRQIVGSFRQPGVLLPLTLTPGEIRLNRPQTPEGPFPYAVEEVSFANGDAVLKGTLTLPEGCSRVTPVLVMVTGSGQQNRDEEVFGHRPFAVIADAFARAGIATLRYDDRGVGESTGDLTFMTTADVRDDALAGIRLMRERFDRVGVLGHSEGGTVALMLAAAGEAGFIVSLAGMVVSGAETLLFQNRRALLEAGFPEETVEVYCKAAAQAYEVVSLGGRMPDIEELALPDTLKRNFEQALVQLNTPYMKYFVEMDMRPLLGSIDCPVMALNGTKDVQVDSGTNLEALLAGLKPDPSNVIEAVPGLNHLFQHCTTGSTSEYGSIEETFAPEVLERMVSWISALK